MVGLVAEAVVGWVTCLEGEAADSGSAAAGSAAGPVTKVCRLVQSHVGGFALKGRLVGNSYLFGKHLPISSERSSEKSSEKSSGSFR